jgi:CTP:molybdopterin cytidylyltransferase MocA
MELPKRVAGVVLAGGRSSWMSGDKSLILLAGKPLPRMSPSAESQVGDA